MSTHLPAMNPVPVRLALKAPVMLVVVDTEEEFDWSSPFNRHATSTRSIPAQDHAHAIYDRYGVVPTYVLDFPVATNPKATAYFRRLVDAGRAEVGTHCHPWVTPPHEEEVNVRNSFHGNLPLELEEAKIRASTDAVAQAFGLAPTVFKAGRYGVGRNTFDILRRLGYAVDCSFVPHTSFSSGYGPNFKGQLDDVFFTERDRSLLEVPLTVGFSGLFGPAGPKLADITESKLARQVRLPGILSRLRLLERARLSPEGFDLATQCRLLDAMVGKGIQVFTLTYHSPSLAPGNTPYVRSSDELAQFLQRVEGVLAYFKDRIGGRFISMSGLLQAATANEDQSPNRASASSY